MRISMMIRPLLAKPCWRINYDCQLGLDLSFGTPYLEVEEPREPFSGEPVLRAHYARRRVSVKASCWLWVQEAHWAVTLADGRRVTRNSSSKGRGVAFAHLEGEKVTAVAVDPRDGATRFLFDLGGSLTVRRFRNTADDTLWTFYKPNGYCLSVRSDGRYSNHPCSHPVADSVWMSLR